MKDANLPQYIKLRKSTRARRLALRLDVMERVFHLVVPPGISMKQAQRFAEENDGWMREHLRTLPRQVPLKNGSIIPIFGKNRVIRVYTKKTLKTTEIILKYNELLVFTNLDDPSARIKRYLMKFAKEQLTLMAEEKAARIGRRIKTICVRDTKSRWGSCSEDAILSFSWRLVLAPYQAMDYVVAHEVAHIRHLNHGQGFWNLCRELSDDYLEGKFWMENYGHELMRYGS
jgi:predicted metal-dependent hydrolase